MRLLIKGFARNLHPGTYGYKYMSCNLYETKWIVSYSLQLT